MGDAVANWQQSNQDGETLLGDSSVGVSAVVPEDPAQQDTNGGEHFAPPGSSDLPGHVSSDLPSRPDGSSGPDLLGSSPHGSHGPRALARGDGDPGTRAPEPFEIHDLLLLEARQGNPVEIDTLIFDDLGIGVIRSRGDQARILPWSSVLAQVVEPWRGGIAPEWWVDPELNRSESMERSLGSVIDPGATSRALPHVEPGALIAVQTATGIFRFLLPGGDARKLARQISAFAVKSDRPGVGSSSTRVVNWGVDAERRKVERQPDRRITWATLQPYLVVLLIVFIAAAVTLILLQSAGVVHLPYLGGNGSGSGAVGHLGPVREGR
jgi:hypothetical protein